MKPLSPSEAEVLRLLLQDADAGKSFTQLMNGFQRKISQRGLSDALRSLAARGAIEKNTEVKSKGAHWNYRITHPAPEEILISDVISFLKAEPWARYMTGVQWIGVLWSSDKSLGIVLNEDQDYNKAVLQLFLTVHEKWRNHAIKGYIESGRESEVKMIQRYETELLECHKLYGAKAFIPFTQMAVPIDDMAKLHYSIVEHVDTMRGLVARDGKRRSYVDFVLWWLRYMKETSKVTEAVKAEAEHHRRYLSSKKARRVYEAFLSRTVPPRSVLVMPFGFASPVQRASELVAQYEEAFRRPPAKSGTKP